MKAFLSTTSSQGSKELLSYCMGEGVPTSPKIFISEGGEDSKGRSLELNDMEGHPSSVETTKDLDEVAGRGVEYAALREVMPVELDS